LHSVDETFQALVLLDATEEADSQVSRRQLSRGALVPRAECAMNGLEDGSCHLSDLIRHGRRVGDDAIGVDDVSPPYPSEDGVLLTGMPHSVVNAREHLHAAPA